MIDLEKVIKGLRDIDMFIAGRLGYEQAKNFLHTIDETVVLLKEKDAVKIEVKKINNSGRCGRCPNCLMELNEVDYPNYCGNCGQAVKWE